MKNIMFSITEGGKFFCGWNDKQCRGEVYKGNIFFYDGNLDNDLFLNRVVLLLKTLEPSLTDLNSEVVITPRQ